MIDEKKRKSIIITAIVFGILVIIAVGAAIISSQQSGLPPKDEPTPGIPSSQDQATLPPATQSTSETTLGNSTFKGFSTLEEQAVTDNRINAAMYYLGQYAASTNGQINSFTLDAASIKQTVEGERKVTTFTAVTNTNIKVTAEISYIYSADNFVRIFDSGGKLLQSSPTEAD